MDKELEYQQFEGDDGLITASRGNGSVDLGRIGEVPMELSVQIGRTQMTVGETLALRVGSIVILDRYAGEPVDLLVNGTPIARGEVVVIDEKFGLRMEEILEDQGGEPENTLGHQATAGEASAGQVQELDATEALGTREQELAA